VKMDLEDMFMGQPQITVDKIQGMLTSPRRRVLTLRWQGINEPKDAGGDWGIRLPFVEPLGP
jgi:hypothetical protein